MIDTARNALGQKAKVVLVHCGDPRIRENLNSAVESELSLDSDIIFRQLYPGVSRAIVDDSRCEVNLANIGDYFDLGAEGVILAHHGEICHAYGKDQDRQLHDLRKAGRVISDRFDCLVVGLWQENPGVPKIDVIEIWQP